LHCQRNYYRRLTEGPSNLANFWKWIITPAIFEILEHNKSGKGLKDDALKGLAQRETMYAYNFENRKMMYKISKES
jgi:UTP--glucose-1-phosphate uridylyltransferase